MLIEFSVTNFRSIRERQTLSMVAVPRLGKKENVFTPSVKGEKFPPLLKVAAIYGPNASGKSSLVMAFDVLRTLARWKPDTEVRKLPVSGFRFDPNLTHAASQIEVHFIYAEQRYEFLVSATQDRIIEEKLISFPGGKENFLYSRKHIDGRDEYKFGDNLEGGGLLHETWRNLTSPQVLFLSQAVANSNEDLLQLRQPFNWISSCMTMAPDEINGWIRASKRIVKENDWAVERIVQYLENIDVPVTKVEFDNSRDIDNSDVPVESKNKLKNLLSLGDENQRMTLTHRTALGEAQFDLEEESGGTKNLIGFWIPWTVLGASSLKGEAAVRLMRVFWVDELDSSLHPEVVAQLVRQHIANDNGTQLIFTTHDTHLMNTKLLRRDQIWITERDINGATRLNSIHDFEGREGEDIEKRYFEGRYRGLPIVNKG